MNRERHRKIYYSSSWLRYQGTSVMVWSGEEGGCVTVVGMKVEGEGEGEIGTALEDVAHKMPKHLFVQA
jgi:hypothetical protein